MADGGNVVISMATYGKRIEKIEMTFDTVLKQDVPCERIFVNVQDDLSDSEFSRFKMLEKRDSRVTVVKRPSKWRSFNKYVHAYYECPDSDILTCDDDIMYGDGYFKALIDEHRRNEDCIVCHESNPMVYSNGGFHIVNCFGVKLLQKDFGKFMTGCTMFPAHCFDKSSIRLDDYDRFFELTNATHDEIWLWTLATMIGLRSITLNWTMSFNYDGALPPEETALCNINGNSENILKYEDRINSLYGKRLHDAAVEVPVVFGVDRSNFAAVYANIGSINQLYASYNVLFDCSDDISRSQLIFMIQSINRLKWFCKVDVRHKLMENVEND